MAITLKLPTIINENLRPSEPAAEEVNSSGPVFGHRSETVASGKLLRTLSLTSRSRRSAGSFEFRRSQSALPFRSNFQIAPAGALDIATAGASKDWALPE